MGSVSLVGNGRRNRGWNTDLRGFASFTVSGHQQVFPSASDGTTEESSAAGQDPVTVKVDSRDSGHA